MQPINLPPIAGEHPLDTAARAAGGRDRLAEKLGVSVAAIGNWKKRGVPIDKCTGIEAASHRVVKRQALRPIDWMQIWPELAQSLSYPAHAGAGENAGPQGA